MVDLAAVALRTRDMRVLLNGMGWVQPDVAQVASAPGKAWCSSNRAKPAFIEVRSHLPACFGDRLLERMSN
jgi:hypothetical protein